MVDAMKGAAADGVSCIRRTLCFCRKQTQSEESDPNNTGSGFDFAGFMANVQDLWNEFVDVAFDHDQALVSTHFVDRMWTEKNINDFLDARDGKWSMFWMAIALNEEDSCEDAWNSMNSNHKIKNIFDLLESKESYDRVVGENTQLFAKYTSKLSDDVAANQIEISEDQKKKLSTFLLENPVNNVLESDDEKENDNGDEIQSVPSKNNIDEDPVMIIKESDDQNQMHSNENESDSVRNDIVDKQSVQLTPKQENTEIDQY